MKKIYSTIPMNALARPDWLNKQRKTAKCDDNEGDEQANVRPRTQRPRPIDIYDNEQDTWYM